MAHSERNIFLPLVNDGISNNTETIAQRYSQKKGLKNLKSIIGKHLCLSFSLGSPTLSKRDFTTRVFLLFLRNFSEPFSYRKLSGDRFERLKLPFYNFTFEFKLRTQLHVKQVTLAIYTAQKIKFFIKDFFSKCDQIRSFLRIWSHILKKSLIENFIFCLVLVVSTTLYPRS